MASMPTRFIPEEFNSFNFVPPPEAPIFEPSKADFKNPLQYINKIKPYAEKYGICKIKAPQEWQPPFAVDIKNFKFDTRIQVLNKLEARTRIKVNFIEKIKKFWDLQGNKLDIPVMGGKLLDLHLLYSTVESEGGFYTICDLDKWRKIAAKVGVHSKHHNDLKSYYEHILFPYLLFTQKTPLNINPKDFSRANQGEEEDIILRYADEEVKKNIENARRLSLSEDAEARSKRKTEKKKRSCTVDVDYGLKKTKRVETPAVKEASDDSEDPFAKYLCVNCEGGDEEESLLLCDGCDDCYHTFCLVPPLMDIPEGDWRCPVCVAKDLYSPESYGFGASPKIYTLEEFGKKADQFKINYFRTGDVSCEQVEKEYWNILSRFDRNISVEYGADLLTVDHGSGFPSKRTANIIPDPETPKYLESPWNLNNLPVLPSSVLGFIKADISGMKIPWMYIAMCFSSFCWHNEDHWSYSINYLHWGEAKTWYGVPGKYADQFENVMKSAAPELFNDEPDLLQQLTTTLNPNVFMFEGVPVYRTDQQAGEFVITFPRAYHAGFNQGYNCAEAVNFAPLDWVPVGRECVEYYSRLKRNNVFSQEELIYEMASKCEILDAVSAAVTREELVLIIEREKKFRSELHAWGVALSELTKFENFADDLRQCEICKTTVYMSAVSCKCKFSDRKIVCYRHFKDLCSCPPNNHILRYRWKLTELLNLCGKLKLKSGSYESWLKNLDDLSSSSADTASLTANGFNVDNGASRKGVLIRIISTKLHK